MSFWNKMKMWLDGGELAVIHEFHRPPYGGGNQFLLALVRELEKMGFRVSQNRVGKSTRVLLVNSFNFDFEKVKAYKRRNIRIVHRVDGPVSIYRSLPDSTFDQRIADWNLEMADATVLQSRYSKEMHESLGIHFKNPVIIPNAVNPEFFFRPNFSSRLSKIRIGGTSWSTNPKKGLALYSWIDENLDFTRFEVSFMGRVEGAFKNIRVYPPKGSAAVGDFLRKQDIYFMPSENECCSNALIEALTSGLPAVYKNSGSSPELVGAAGEPFERKEELLALFERVAEDLEQYREKIRVLSISEVAKKYAQLLKLQSEGA